MADRPPTHLSTTEFARMVQARGERAHSPGSCARPARGLEQTWVELAADTVGEALIQAWAINGLDHVFFCSGTDLVWMSEGVAKSRELGRPTPRILTMLHEFVALSAAAGYTMVSRRPALTAAHVDAGTMNYGGAIHNTGRGQYPVMITSGKTPSAYGGTAPGDRDALNLWAQDLTDHGGLTRAYTKWDYELRTHDNPGLIVGRGLQLALQEPRGPVYLSIPRDVAMSSIEGARFPTVSQLAVPRPPAADPDAIATAARLLIDARRPLVISQNLGRDPDAVAPMVALAELLALPFVDPRRERMNFPSTHPLYRSGPRLAEADLVFAIEAVATWQPGYAEPSPAARIVTLGTDPAASRNVYHEFTADLRITASPATGLKQLHEEVDELLSVKRRREIAERRGELAAVSRARRERLDLAALAHSRQPRISPEYLGYELARALPADAIVLNEAVTNVASIDDYFGGVLPGQLFQCGGTGGGWGPGAALGAKLAAPHRFVALAIGDGFFLYGVPYAALWSAIRYRAPFLTVVYQNLGYTTGSTAVAGYYPDGYAVREGKFEGGMIDPPPDLAKLAESAGAWAVTVHAPEQLRGTLDEAVRIVEQGSPAVVVVRLPRLGSERSAARL